MPLQECGWQSTLRQLRPTSGIHFTKLGEVRVRAHRSVLDGMKCVGMTRKEPLHALVKLPIGEPGVDSVKHITDSSLVTESEVTN
jgi:hypothetical protein